MISSMTAVLASAILGPVSIPGGGRVPNSVPLYLGKLVTEL
jgi:hypothetical protein